MMGRGMMGMGNGDHGDDRDDRDNGDNGDNAHLGHGGRPVPCAAQRCCAPGTHSAPHRRARRHRSAASRPGPPPAAAACLWGHSPVSPLVTVSPSLVPVFPATNPGRHLPSHSRVGGGLPVTTQRNSAGCPGATLSCGGSTAAVGAAAVPAVVRAGAGAQGSPGPPRPGAGTKVVGVVGSGEGGSVAQPAVGCVVEPRHAAGGMEGSAWTPPDFPAVTYPVGAPP